MHDEGVPVFYKYIGDWNQNKIQPVSKRLGKDKRYGPFMQLHLGENSNIVSSPEYAEQVMKIHDVTFSSRPYNLGASIYSLVIL